MEGLPGLPGASIRDEMGTEMPLWDLFWAMCMFFLLVLWLWLLFVVFSDLFRAETSGWGKALWAVFLIIMPFLSVLVYLVVHGGPSPERSARQASGTEWAPEDYMRTVAGTYSTGVSGWPSSTTRTY